MLYSEFVEGTGCRENDHNYQVYKNLEIMYMNSDMSKSQIYEYGKKLVDNSKTEKEIEIENDIKAEIAALKEEIQIDKNNLEWEEKYLDNGIKDPADAKRMIKFYKNQIAEKRNRIATLKHFFLDK